MVCPDRLVHHEARRQSGRRRAFIIDASAIVLAALAIAAVWLPACITPPQRPAYVISPILLADLQEIEGLLIAYTDAVVPPTASPQSFLAWRAIQAARYARIEDLIIEIRPSIPTAALTDYRDRLSAARSTMPTFD